MTTFIHPSNGEIVEPGPVRQVDGRSRRLGCLLSDKSGLSASIGEVIGAITISMVVLALSGFGIASGINYSQDSNAEAALQSVRSAQILHQTKTDEYGTMDELLAGDTPSLRNAPDGVHLYVDEDGRNYCAFIESGSMSRPQFLSGPRGGIVELRAKVDPKTFKGCTVQGRSVVIKKHGSDQLAIAAVPPGAGTACLRFNFDPGPEVTNWYIGIKYLDAALKPVGNTKMANPAGGFYTSNGAARVASTNGDCFPVGPEVKNVQWGIHSAAQSDRTGIGSTYRDLVMTFH